MRKIRSYGSLGKLWTRLIVITVAVEVVGAIQKVKQRSNLPWKQ